jgi:ankyrin repeat protein
MNTESITRFYRHIARLLLLSLSIGSLGAADLAERLQKGLFEEEANQNLNAAIEQYQAIITASDEQRKVTATALHRLAECYRKLGKQKEADELRARLARDFSDQAQFLTGKQAPARDLNPYAGIIRLLDNSPDLLNAPSITNSFSYLQYAASSGNLELMQILLDRGALVDTPNTLPPLLLAIRQGHKKAAELLIKAGADVNGKVADGSLMPLGEAAWKGFTSISELLIENGAALNSHDSSGQTPLHYAAGGDHLQEMQLLLSKGADIDAKTFSGKTPLIVSTETSHSAAAILLVNSNAQVNVKDDAGNTALWFAVLHSLRDCNSLLLAKNADPNIQDRTGTTALMLAIDHGDNNTCELLVKAKADLNIADKEGRTALHHAISKQNPRVLELLLGAGADPNLKDNRTFTALDYASGARYVDMSQPGISHQPILIQIDAMRVLLKHGAEIGRAIWIALDHPEALKLLLEAKADPNVKSNEGRTPLDYVTGSNPGGIKPEARELLVRYGATNSTQTSTNSIRLPRP